MKMHETPYSLHESPQLQEIPRYCGFHRADKGRDFPTHQHPMWELVYYRAGHIRVSVGDNWLDVRPGMMVLTPPHTPHCELALTAYENIHFLVDAPAEIG